MTITESLGDLGKAIEDYIDQSVRKHLIELIEPITVLKDFRDVEVLTLDEVCNILRYGTDKNSKDKIRDACKRGELPYTQIGRDYLFPKRLVVEFLLGQWKKPEKVKQPRTGKYDDLETRARKFVND